MGRSKHYRSPSTMKRSSERLLHHLHKMVKILTKMVEQTKSTTKNDMNFLRQSNKRESRRYESNKMNGNKIDTLSIYEEDDTLFFTSTPKKPRFFCCEYWNEPFKEAGTSKLATDRPHRDWILWLQAPFRAAAGRCIGDISLLYICAKCNLVI